MRVVSPFPTTPLIMTVMANTNSPDVATAFNVGKSCFASSN